MRTLMLGWEFPPFISGGLGTACHGLTGALARLETRILFVLPTVAKVEGQASLGLAAVPVARPVAHVHSTEFDRTGERVNHAVHDVERAGVHGAPAVVAVSNRTGNILVDRCGVDLHKVRLVRLAG